MGKAQEELLGIVRYQYGTTGRFRLLEQGVLRRPGEHHGSRARTHRLGREVVTVNALTRKCHEQAVALDKARIDEAAPADTGGVAGNSAGARSSRDSLYGELKHAIPSIEFHQLRIVP